MEKLNKLEDMLDERLPKVEEIHQHDKMLANIKELMTNGVSEVTIVFDSKSSATYFRDDLKDEYDVNCNSVYPDYDYLRELTIKRREN